MTRKTNRLIIRLASGGFALSLAAIGSNAVAGPSVPGDVQWTINSLFTDGTSVVGNFYTDVYGFFDTSAPWSLTTQSDGSFVGYVYDEADTYVASGSNFIDVEPGYQQDLHLQFSQPLTVPSNVNTIVAAASYECQMSYSCYVPSGGVTRYLDPAATGPGSATGNTPEPATWVMMLVGVVGIGSVLRRRAKALPASEATKAD